MAQRAHFITFLVDGKGEPIAGANIILRNQGTTTPISETIYAAEDPSTTTLSNPILSDTDGKVEFYLVAPQRLDIRIEKTGYTPRTFTIDVLKLPSNIGIREGGVEMAPRGSLNFEATGFEITDDLASDETEVRLKSIRGFDDVSNTVATAGQILSWDSGLGMYVPISLSGNVDHGALTGLGDDDHPQYLNVARANAIYALLGHNHDGTYQLLSQKGQANGYAGLGADGLVPSSQLPPESAIPSVPLTTKGDLLSRNATVNVRVPVGSNDQLLIADSAQAAGVKWGGVPVHGSGSHPDVTRAFLIPIGAVSADGGTFATYDTGAGSTRYVSLSNAATEGVFGSFLVPSDCVDDELQITFLWTVGGFNAGNVRWRFAYGTGDITSVISNTNVDWTESGAGAVDGLHEASPAPISNAMFTANNWIRFWAGRIGGHADDTHTQAMRLLAVRIDYTASG